MEGGREGGRRPWGGKEIMVDNSDEAIVANSVVRKEQEKKQKLYIIWTFFLNK